MKKVDVLRFAPRFAVATYPILLNSLFGFNSSSKYFLSIPFVKPNIEHGRRVF
jgi:hypothetical protein